LTHNISAIGGVKSKVFLVHYLVTISIFFKEKLIDLNFLAINKFDAKRYLQGFSFLSFSIQIVKIPAAVA
jgi:hypothetical protein